MVTYSIFVLLAKDLAVFASKSGRHGPNRRHPQAGCMDDDDDDVDDVDACSPEEAPLMSSIHALLATSDSDGLVADPVRSRPGQSTGTWLLLMELAIVAATMDLHRSVASFEKHARMTCCIAM